MTISGVGDGVSVAVAVTVGVGLGRGVEVAVGVRVRVGVEVNGGPNTLPGPQEASRKVTMSNRRKFFLSMVELYSRPAGCVWDSFYLAGDGTEKRHSHFPVKASDPSPASTPPEYIPANFYGYTLYPASIPQTPDK